ncbi:hypothetical protein IAU60_004089 [Kwoniella sp. DSM 27419]
MAYQYPPYHQAQYYPPPPQPAIDPFRAYYADRLRQLTFNSRPLIQDLSVTAMAQRDQNNWEGMATVVEEIEQAVLRATPQTKLPLLYLIDSISKNIGPPYTTHLLPPIIPRLYLRTYREVDGVTKAKMEEIINLWRTSGPDRGDLYGPGVREQIERDIFGSMPTLQQVRAAVKAALDNKQREAISRDWDPALGQQVNALAGISQLLNTSNVSPQELAQIMEQVKTMAAPIIPKPTPQWNAPARPPPQQQQPVPSLNLPPFPAATTRSTMTSTPLPGSVTPIPGSTTPVPVAAPVPIPPVANLPIDVSKILNSLNKSGVVSQPRTPEAQPIPLVKSPLEAYEESILNLNAKLQSIDLNAPRVLSLDHLPHRCKQCGMRFPADDAKFQAHMDWHFRRNRKERESAGRGAHRRWLPRVEEWASDVAEAGPSNIGSPSKAQASHQVAPERLAQLRQKWVKVPSDNSKATAVCPVCKETLKAEWSEDEEEWIWKNALNINGVIYHATCRAEQLSALRRMKGSDPNRRSNSGSPGVTPQPDQVKSEGGPSAVAQVKRKAEENATRSAEAEAKRVKVEPGVGSVGGDVATVKQG